MISLLKRSNSLEIRECLFAIIGIVLLGLSFSYFEAFEYLYNFSRSHENWELDEIIIILLMSPIFLVWLVIKRWTQSVREMNLRLKREHQLAQQSTHDALTGLPNRVLLEDRLNIAQSSTSRVDSQISLMVIDLDDFKLINDELGTSIGNRILCVLADRFRAVIKTQDTIARLSGDEFAAVLWDSSLEDSSLSIAQRLLDCCSEPILMDGFHINVTASIGITFYPLDPKNALAADQLIRQADQALYQAKITGKNCYSIYDTENARQLSELHSYRKRIELAVDRHELHLHYQPQINMTTGLLVGAEALVRWQHPERGLLGPNQFLHVVEDHSLSIKLGEWVIENALSQIHHWSKAGHQIKVSVNISALHIQQGNFVERLQSFLNQFPDVAANKLQLEITETGSLEDLNGVAATIGECLTLGVGFALDDFGTGYSSLTYLQSLPSQLIKIDRSFVRDMLDDPNDLRMVKGIISLARTFDLPVIAEGVESYAQQEKLLELGCELAQGFIYSKALSANDFESWLSTWNHTPRVQRLGKKKDNKGGASFTPLLSSPERLC
ncbi:bifunctional diguanylate cyclase/phosphodiesterase [Alginatibacterium sediminis]|uniref:Bifunctional diguanylate cyclase/phosphodiesterase n=1 Tax=Alginatibacterium sediminis TaxID=2164068 RepID=A0A420EH00_9ALTE|nr:bifunctional diguanylate cyclase/phosphodiesterase [Alginatibacterium sediminis]RKF19992.1 bifunctional diguanylate cyclase/phosphodiesterase [Alginatibacterium sediminis]